MTIDDAIKHAEAVAEKNEKQAREQPQNLGYIEKFYDCKKCAEEHRQLAKWLKELKALKTQDKGLDQWCTDCKEYDAEKHCCPRFNRVIREALSESKRDSSDLHSACTEVARDTVSRQDAIDALDKRFDSIPMEQTTEILMLRKDLRELPSAQPEIIRCKDCIKQDLCAWYRDGAKYCSFAERRTDE